MYNKIDEVDKVYTIFAVNDIGGGTIGHKEGNIAISVNQKTIADYTTSQDTNTLALIAHEGAHAWLHLIGEEPEDITEVIPNFSFSRSTDEERYNQLKILRETKASFFENQAITDFIHNGIKGLKNKEFCNINLLNTNFMMKLNGIMFRNENLN